MNLRIQSLYLFPLLSLLISVQVDADFTTAEFRHFTDEFGGPSIPYYGCETCTFPGFMSLPPNAMYAGPSAPATANYTLTTDIINTEPFEFGAQAGLIVDIDETNLPANADKWAGSEVHVESAVEFADVATVYGVPRWTIWHDLVFVDSRRRTFPCRLIQPIWESEKLR